MQKACGAAAGNERNQTSADRRPIHESHSLSRVFKALQQWRRQQQLLLSSVKWCDVNGPWALLETASELVLAKWPFRQDRKGLQ